jgi:predicted amidophosphoribosyltransferase
MIFATRCAGCHARGSVLCRTCRFALVARPAPGAPAGIVVASAYSGRVRDVLLGLKYHNRRLVAAHVAGLLAQRLAIQPTVDGVDVVTWAPTSGSRRRRRGFDQAELIARAVAAHLGLPCRRLLERDGTVPAQTGRSRRERLAGPRFRVHPRAAGRGVLVVDDVVTTGATLDSAARSLRRGGATAVVLAAVAATPDCLLPAQRVA